MAKCVNCKRYAQEENEFCWHCDPNVSQEVKRAAQAKGGANSRKIPHNLDKDALLPIETPEDLRKLFNALLGACFDAYEDDLAGLVKQATRITPRLSELLAFETLAALDNRLAQIEAKKQRYLPGVINADNNGTHSEN